MDRDELVSFCIKARCEIEGIQTPPASLIRETNAMSYEELEREADWLDDMLGK